MEAFKQCEKEQKELNDMKALLICVLVCLLAIIPVSAESVYEPSFDQTNFTVIEQTTLNNLTFANQVVNVYDQNQTLIYTMSYPPLVTKTVTLGLDLQIMLQILQTFALLIIMLLILIRSVYGFILWMSSRRS